MVNKNNTASILLKFFISFGLLLVLLWAMRKDAENVIETLKSSKKVFFAIAMFVNLPLTILLAYRLKLLMKGQKIYMEMKDAVYLTFIGFFFNNFLPTSIGGDIAKAYYASKKTNNKASSYAAVLTDRLIGFLSCLSIAAIGIIFVGKDFENNTIVFAIGGTVIFMALIMVILLNRRKSQLISKITAEKGLMGKVKDIISKLYTTINFYQHHKKLLIQTYLLGMFMQACTVGSIYLLILSVGGNINILRLFLIIPLIWAVSMLPSLNGLGVREGAFVYFLKGDIGRDLAFSISLLWLGIIIVYGIIGGILHLLYPVKVEAVSSKL